MAKTYTPNDGMASAARRALNWKKEGKRGGTRVGLERANQLVKKESLSADTVMRMHSFFSRHEVNKKAEGFNSGEKGFPSPGRVAWDLWGGDAGASWSKQKRDQIMRERMNKSVWSGVFFPKDEPEEMSLVEQDLEDAPLESAEIVETNFEVEREDISEDTSVTNEVEVTPEIIDETVSVEETVSIEENVETKTNQVVEESGESVSEEVVLEEPEVTEE